jgi:zinc transporter
MNDLTLNSFPIDGVVFAWGMTSSGENYEIPLDQITRTLDDPEQSMWLHLNLAHAQVQRWLDRTDLIPERVVEMIREGVTRSRLERIERLNDCLVMVMNDFHQEFGVNEGEATLGTLWAILTPRLMISLRNKPLNTTDKLRSDLRGGQLLPHSAIELFHELIDLRAEYLRTLLIRLSERMDDLEEILLKGREIPEHENLGRIRIHCSRLRRQFAPELVALHRLQKIEVEEQKVKDVASEAIGEIKEEVAEEKQTIHAIAFKNNKSEAKPIYDYTTGTSN